MAHAAEIGSFAGDRAEVRRVLVVQNEWFLKHATETVTDPVTGEVTEEPMYTEEVDPDTGETVLVPVLVEDRETGEARCSVEFGGEWKQTSYNGNFRANFASVGYEYDRVLDVFIPPPSFPSWTLDTVAVRWIPPVVPPSTAHTDWDEGLQTWMDPAKRVPTARFVRRFHEDEADEAEASTDPYVVGLWAELDRRPFVRLDSPTTVNGVNYLETTALRADGVTKILPAGRATQILS
jgi:hypothetical protein